MMAARWYCVQAAHFIRGWLDLPSLSSMKKSEADLWAREFAETRNVATRTIRKPHGWEPPPPSAEEAGPIEAADSTMYFADFQEGETSVSLDPEESPKLARKHEKMLRNRPPTWHARIMGKDPF